MRRPADSTCGILKCGRELPPNCSGERCGSIEEPTVAAVARSEAVGIQGANLVALTGGAMEPWGAGLLHVSRFGFHDCRSWSAAAGKIFLW